MWRNAPIGGRVFGADTESGKLLGSLRRERPQHGLDFEELFKPVDAPFAAVARSLIAAKRRGRIGESIVDMHVARPQARRNVTRMLKVARRHIARKTIDRVVGDP